jgi:dihydrofolate reductase
VGRLIYSAICSLDGFVEDAGGRFDWAAPDAEVHSFVNDQERPIGTYLYGRRMYETMRVWQTPETFADSPETIEYAEIWQAADKVVYSRTLDSVGTPKTRLEREFDANDVERLKAESKADISIGGAELASAALAANLVDAVHLFLNPVLVGAGKPALRTTQLIDLKLIDERRFASGVVHLHYSVA